MNDRPHADRPVNSARFRELASTHIMNKPHIFGIVLISFTMTAYLIGISSPKRINSTTPVQSEDAEQRLKN